ncbi:hypothetical protein OUZ56_011828 [Daphnia magna]|uniref:Uncharacterized protein n=1 Tax=Daphnia magna TaxID=35525 RepID=A0ABQ9Z2K0_9CRUS|nr:hypothetical protein OUZ56_011828 [Daphnia magna]
MIILAVTLTTKEKKIENVLEKNNFEYAECKITLCKNSDYQKVNCESDSMASSGRRRGAWHANIFTGRLTVEEL